MMETDRYIKQIDEDFKEIPIKRLIQLEKSWIRDISHKVMKRNKFFVHDDRKVLRRKLYNHLHKRIKENDKRGIKKKGIKK